MIGVTKVIIKWKEKAKPAVEIYHSHSVVQAQKNGLGPNAGSEQQQKYTDSKYFVSTGVLLR
jgi:hypothetical protein